MDIHLENIGLRIDGVGPAIIPRRVRIRTNVGSINDRCRFRIIVVEVGTPIDGTLVFFPMFP